MGQQLRVMFDQVANSATATPVGMDPSRFGESNNEAQASNSASNSGANSNAQLPPPPAPPAHPPMD